MAEKQAQPIKEALRDTSDWPTLVERVVDDVSRILRSEAQMFQTNLGAALELKAAGAIAHLAMVVVMLSGSLCIIFAAILLLHERLPWWQAFGTVGIATLFAGITMNTSMRRRSQVEVEKRLSGV